jgi:hypothetical protein
MKDDIRKELLDRGLSDMLQLSEMAWVARRDLSGTPDEGEIMRATTEVISELVGSGYAIVGDVAKDDEGVLYVSSWSLESADTIKRIEAEWCALGRPPNLGDVCWLELSESGRAHALDVFRPRYMVHQGMFYVWFSGERSVKRHSFDCLLNVTDKGELVGIEIPDCRQQLEDASFPPARANGAFQWSYDAERDIFSVRLGQPSGGVQKESSGRARVDDQGAILDLQVTLGDEVASEDRDLTFIG